MFLAKHKIGILELGEELIILDPEAEVIEVPDSFSFDPEYFYDIVDGKVVRYPRLKLEDEDAERVNI